MNNRKELRKTMDRFLKEWPLGKYSENTLSWERIRCVFTGMCFIYQCIPDTEECDNLLWYMYEKGEVKESKMLFDQYMLTYLR